jgi:hypothetical protein
MADAPQPLVWAGGTGVPPVPPELPPQLLANHTRRARVQGLPSNSKCDAVDVCQVGRGLRTRRASRAARRGRRALPFDPSQPQLLPAHTRRCAGSGTMGHLRCAPVGPAVSNPQVGSRSARRSDPTPGPKDKVQMRWALGITSCSSARRFSLRRSIVWMVTRLALRRSRRDHQRPRRRTVRFAAQPKVAPGKEPRLQ